MAIDSLVKELVDETMKALQSAKFTRDSEVRINPRRMRALILFSQQRMQVQMNGLMLTLVEDANAPELATAINDVIEAPLPEPVGPTPEEIAEYKAWKQKAENMAANQAAVDARSK